MKQPYLEKICLIILAFSFFINLFSCSSTKKIKYFQDIPDSGRLNNIPKAEYADLRIQSDDIISVIIETIDPTATQMVNSGNVTVGTASSSTMSPTAGNAISGFSSMPQQGAVSGYLVDRDGNIDVPVIGQIEAKGHTTTELKNIIYKEALKYYNSPTVIVRFANFKVSVTGEVLRPGVYSMPNEKVSILDAIAMAGDLTVFGKRDNVLLIRENVDGTKTPYRINLKKSDIMSSPYFYLRQNDVIYVQPDTGKAAATDASQAKYYAIVSSVLSVLIVFLSRR